VGISDDFLDKPFEMLGKVTQGSMFIDAIDDERYGPIISSTEFV
jgi:hypothetical protein